MGSVPSDLKRRLYVDVAVVLSSLVLAYWIGTTQVVGLLVESLGDASILATIIAGGLYTSGFTVGPAAVLLYTLSLSTSAVGTVLWGTLGAVLADYLIFLFIRDRFSEDLLAILRIKLPHLFKRATTPFARAAFYILGVAVIVTPLPDEIALAFLGVSKTSTFGFLPIVIAANIASISLILIGGNLLMSL
jgi:hypothetical protein